MSLIQSKNNIKKNVYGNKFNKLDKYDILAIIPLIN